MEYKIVYSGRKTLALSLKNGELTVRAPFGTTVKRIEEEIAKHTEWIALHIEKQRRRAFAEESIEERELELRCMAKEILPKKTAYYAELMGLKYNSVRINGAKTRFGSCSAKKNISYSYRLMAYPEEAIDYVVVHELAHLVEMNHSPRFYNVIARVLPDYKARKRLLKI